MERHKKMRAENPLFKIFLSYANTGNLYEVFSAVAEYNDSINAGIYASIPSDLPPSNYPDHFQFLHLRTIPYDRETIDPLLKALVELYNMGEHSALFTKTMVESQQIKKWWNREKVFHRAYEAVYGYESTDCIRCINGDPVRTEIHWVNPFRGERIHCFECHHVIFHGTLKRIASKDSLDGCWLEDYIEASNRLTYRHRFIVDGRLREETLFDHSRFWKDFRLNSYVDAIVGHALVEFLQANSQLRLRYCNRCENFFIGERAEPRTKPSYCSPRCKDAFHSGRKMRTWLKNSSIYEATRAEKEYISNRD